MRGRDLELHGFREEGAGLVGYMGLKERERVRVYELHGFREERERYFELHFLSNFLFSLPWGQFTRVNGSQEVRTPR